jgi:hypothetical protein
MWDEGMSSRQPLLSLIEETMSIITEIEHEAKRGVEVWSLTWSIYLAMFRSEFETIQSVIDLVKSHRYKDCMVLLRSVFEYYFMLLLMIKGKKYKETRTYRIEPTSSLTLEAARDRTLEKWRQDWRSGKPEYAGIIDIQKGRDDRVILVTLQSEGLYMAGDVDKKGEPIPKFYFVFEEYDPSLAFLSDLPVFATEGRGLGEIAKKHKHLYSQYLYIKKIFDNLRLNELITRDQGDRFWVHYNFLSSFAHPTRWALLNYSPWTDVNAPEPVLQTLVMYYVAQFEAKLIRTVTEFFSHANRSADFSGSIALAEKLEQATKDFWFIFNEPSDLDKRESELQKTNLRILGLPVPKGTIYYTDPIERIKAVVGKENLRRLHW